MRFSCKQTNRKKEKRNSKFQHLFRGFSSVFFNINKIKSTIFQWIKVKEKKNLFPDYNADFFILNRNLFYDFVHNSRCNASIKIDAHGIRCLICDSREYDAYHQMESSKLPKFLPRADVRFFYFISSAREKQTNINLLFGLVYCYKWLEILGYFVYIAMQM